MGTSSWMFIEHRDTPSGDWLATSDENLRVKGDYALFDSLAGGRNGSGFLIAPRGLPRDMSEVVLRQACYRLTDSDEEKSRSKLGDRVTKRSCITMEPFGDVFCRKGVDYFYLYNGWMHSYTWLSLREIFDSLAHSSIPLDSLDSSFATITRQMGDFEKSGKQTRLIAWFDAGPVDSPRQRIVTSIHQVLMNVWIPNYPWGISNPVDVLHRYIGPIYQILTNSQSEHDLIDFLRKTESDANCSPASSDGHLKKVATALLSLDVRIQQHNQLCR